jgi:hypothetical protein
MMMLTSVRIAARPTCSVYPELSLSPEKSWLALEVCAEVLAYAQQ